MARTRAADYDEKRQAIIDRAARQFADDGFTRTSMNQIAEACGVSKALLYHYYRSKEDILYDVIADHLEELCGAVEAADDPSRPAEERLHRLVLTILETYRDADAAHTVQINALRFLSEKRQDELREMERRLVRVLSGAVAAVDPRLLDDRKLLKPVTMSLFGILNWSYLWFRSDGPMTREAYAEVVTRMMISGIQGLVD